MVRERSIVPTVPSSGQSCRPASQIRTSPTGQRFRLPLTSHLWTLRKEEVKSELLPAQSARRNQVPLLRSSREPSSRTVTSQGSDQGLLQSRSIAHGSAAALVLSLLAPPPPTVMPSTIRGFKDSSVVNSTHCSSSARFLELVSTVSQLIKPAC